MNHKLGYCSDGVKQKFAHDKVPPWPQPHGIFTKGTDFHPVPFLTALHEIYEKFVPQREAVESISVEHKVFARMLNSCTFIWEDSAVLFRLPCSISISDMVVMESDTRFLCLNCLLDG